MNLNLSTQVAGIVEKAIAICVNRGQFFVGIEQLFAATLESAELLPTAIREKWLNTLMSVHREMGRTPWRTIVASPSGEVGYSPRVIQHLMQSSKIIPNRGPASGGHLLLTIVSDPLARPSRMMDRMNLKRQELIDDLTKELQKLPMTVSHGYAVDVEEGAQQPAVAEGAAAAPPSADAFTTNLSERARQGALAKAIGRDDEMYQMLQVLTRSNKNNVMLVGEAGVGKTQIVEGLARYLAKTPTAGSFEFIQLDVAALMAGTQFRGAFEEKLIALLEHLKQHENTVLFIDEIHLIMGAGATGGDSIDFANLIKPALARGEIRCIGATTIAEYRKFVEKDPAIERRFQMVRVDEMTEEAALKVLEHLKFKLEQHHSIKISPRSLEEAIKLSQRYLPNLRLPDKAIDVLDQACARYRLKLMGIKHAASVFNSPEEREMLTPHEVRKVISQITGLPLDDLTKKERLQLSDLDQRLQKRLIGQDEAVKRAVTAVKKSKAGLADPNRPDAVMLFLGPSGVGKTHLAKMLAEELYGNTTHLHVFDMSEFVEEHSVSRLLGAPPGYAGSEEEGRLSSAIRSTPYSILLFDEVEKAHPRIFDIFLPILEEGRLKDNRGREVNFRNSMIIFTSNIGADLLKEGSVEDMRSALSDALQQHFRPEFVNRIDDIVPFYPLLAEDIRNILWIEMKQIKKRLDEKQIKMKVYQKAYEHLAEAGYNQEYGARELRRVVDQMVTRPISDLIVGGQVDPGDTVEVVIKDGELKVRKAVAKPAEEVAAQS